MRDPPGVGLLDPVPEPSGAVLAEIDGRFPEYAAKVPEQAVAYRAEQVKVDPALFAKGQ